MPWVKFDDKANRDPKIIKLGLLGRLLWEDLIFYAAEHLTDGFIDCPVGTQTGQAIALRAKSELGVSIEGEEIIARLVAVGLLLPEDGGWRIHNYLKYQPSRASTEAKREKERAKKSRQRSPDCPPGSPASPEPDPIPFKKVPKKSATKAPKTPWPEGLVPNDTTRRVAKENGVDVEAFWPYFEASCKAKPYHYADFQQAAQVWIRKPGSRRDFPLSNKPPVHRASEIDPEWAERYAKNREAQRAKLKKPDPWDEEEPDVFEQIGGDS